MTKKEITERVEYWTGMMQLGNWDISIHFDKVENNQTDDNFMAAAQVSCQPAYKLATIVFDDKQLKIIDDSAIVHELIHVLMSPMTAFVDPHIKKRDEDTFDYWKEQLTTELERILLRTAKYGRPRKNKNKSTR